MKISFRQLFLFGLLVVFALAAPSCEAQLFKKGANRRAARQNGGNYNGGMNQQQSNQYQQPRKGLFGKSKEAKTGGLFNGNKQNNTQYSNAQPQQKKGLFGKPKEQKTGGLFNRNKVDAYGQPVQKNGLFGKAKERREAQAYTQQRYSNQSYSQQQINQQASANSVQRSQRASSNQSLFQNKSLATSSGESSVGNGQDRAFTSNSRSDRDASSSASRPALADASRSQIPAVKKTLSEARSQLPQLTRAESKRDANGVAPAEAHRPAIVRSKPKLPERTRQTAIAVEHTRLEDTSKDLPETSPTGPISAPKQVEPGSRTLA